MSDAADPDAIRITLVRHGESESNVTGHWQGQGDSPLSRRGREQAQLLTARLAHGRFDRVLSSDLSRARDTGLAVAARLGRTLETDAAWREIDVGRWEGLTRAQVAARFPEELEALRQGRTIAVGGGESWADLTRRARAALDALLATLRPGAHALVFSHGGVIASIVLDLFGLGARNPRPLGHVDNTGLTTLRFDAHGPRLERFNDTLHLGPLGKWGAARLAAGSTVVAMWDGARSEPPAPPATVLSTGELPPGSAAEALRTLHEAHAGRRIGLRGPSADLAALTTELLAANVACRPRGVTHVVVDPDGRCAVASLDCGPHGLDG